MRYPSLLQILGPVFLGAASVMLLATSASATIYTFVDERGVVHMTNVPTDSRYRVGDRFNLMGGKPGKAPRREAIEAFILEAADRYNVDPMLVKAVIKVESDFDHRAVSKKGAIGLMQLMPETARDLRVHDPFDPKSNIMGGTNYLRQLLSRFDGDLSLGLAAYNAGPQRVVMAQNTVPRLPETLEYIKKVMHHYQRYRGGPITNRWLYKISN
ncbi:MAG: transglycosylase SLT domain-containing protein [Desulfobulbaceae bacterium]|nr:transglycosylase SLT domain-containing protein [Desulfobulbaceae bacterium]